MSVHQTMYEQPQSMRTFPRSISTSSLKSKDRWGLTGKLFGRKGSTSTDTMSSGSCASPVDITPKHTTMSYKPSRTPPHSTSPVSRGPSSSGSSTFADCCYCDIPLQYVLGAEDLVTLSCSHSAHFECLVQLAEVINKNRKSASYFRLPSCGICDQAGAFVDPEAKSRFDQILSDTLHIAKSPAGTDTPKTIETIPVGISTRGSRHSGIANGETCVCTDKACQRSVCSLEFYNEVHTKLPKAGPATVKCLVEVGVSDGKFYNSTYKSTPNDHVTYCREISKLKKLYFKGTPLDRISMNHLRFINNFRISTDLRSWTECTLYLFSTHLIVTSPSDTGPQAKLVIDLDLHLISAKILDLRGAPYLELLVKKYHKSRLFFDCAQVEPLEALCAALYNDKLCFPILPTHEEESYPLVVPASTGEVIHKAPLNFIICVEPPRSVEQANSIIESIQRVRGLMSSFDRLAVIINGAVVRNFGLESHNWSGWKAAGEELLRLGKPDDFVDLDKSLSKAEELLHNLRVERALAALLIISSAPVARATEISTGFIYSDTPIVTIGLDDNYDALTLHSLASKTDALFTACTSRSLKEQVAEVFDTVSRRTHKNVEIKLSPAKGVKIDGVHGFSVDSLDSIMKSPIESLGTDVVYSLKNEDSSCCVPLGSLYEKSKKSFIVSVDIEDCASLDNGKLIDASIFSRQPLSISHHRCTSSQIISAEPAGENVHTLNKLASLDACKFSSDILQLITRGEQKRAFQLTQCDSARFSQRYNATDVTTQDEEVKKQLRANLEDAELFFERFSDQLFQPSSQTTRIAELLQFIWTHS